MSQKLFSSGFESQVQHFLTNKYDSLKGKKDKWFETTTTSSLWSEYRHVIEKRKAHQLTGWRKEILSRNMMLVKKWFVIWATASISGLCFWLCVETLVGRLHTCPKQMTHFFDFWFPNWNAVWLIFHCYLGRSRVLTKGKISTFTKT